MSKNPYPPEELDGDIDNGTMPENVAELAENVVGHRIVKVDTGNLGTVLTLDTGKQVCIADTTDCCAYTELTNVTTHLDRINHVITGVGTTEQFDKWHIYADLGDVVELDVSWSPGNPFYYGYGFFITVKELPEVTP